MTSRPSAAVDTRAVGLLVGTTPTIERYSLATPPGRGGGHGTRGAAAGHPSRDQHSRVLLGTERKDRCRGMPMTSTATGCCQDRLRRVSPWWRLPAFELAGPSNTASRAPRTPTPPEGGSRLLRPTRPVVSPPEIHPNDGRRPRPVQPGMTVDSHIDGETECALLRLERVTALELQPRTESDSGSIPRPARSRQRIGQASGSSRHRSGPLRTQQPPAGRSART